MGQKVTKFFIIFIYYIFFLLVIYMFLLRILPDFLDSQIEIPKRNQLFMIGLFFLVYIILMWRDLYSRNYHYYLKYSGRIVLKNLLISTLIVSLVIGLLLPFFVKNYTVKKLFLLHASCVVASFVIHMLQYAWIRYLSLLGYFKRDVVIVGNPDRRFPVNELFQDIGNTKNYLGKLSLDGSGWIFSNGSADNAEYYPDIHSFLYRKQVGEVIIFIGKTLSKVQIYDLVSFCRENSIGYYLVPDMSKLVDKEPWDKPFPYIPIIERYSTTRDSLTFVSLKRLFDLIFTVIIMLLIFPLCVLIAVAIKLEDGGPIFYISKRIGKNKKLIRFFKFRSMVINADLEKKYLLKYNERRDGPLFKMKSDPRVTKMGKLLRKYSLDELPQFVNVLRGEMSLVGPRPHLPVEVKQYSDLDYLRLECIPGITCLPQIYGRSSLSFREWVDYDLQYRSKWSILLDFKIIFETIKIVLQPFLMRKSEGY